MPAERRSLVDYLRVEHAASIRKACRVVGQSRSLEFTFSNALAAF